MRFRGLWMSLAVMLVASPAHADPQEGATLYLDRCAGGCAVEPGPDDARADTSSLIAGPATLGEFRHGDAAWSELVDCVRATYAPFAIEVTDVDPGDVPHFEAKVAGEPADIGATGIGGLAPFDCGVIDNALTFSFANIYSDVDDLCATVAQESAHAFGLEHEILCDDPMTYMDACGPKRFQDAEAPCGGYGERACECGGTMQSSYRKLLEALGPAGAPVLHAAPPCSGDDCAAPEGGGCAISRGQTRDGWLLLLVILFLRRRRPS